MRREDCVGIGAGVPRCRLQHIGDSPGFRRFDQQVVLHGGAALITGRAEIDVNGRQLNLRFLTVWVDQGGTWRFAAWQSTPLPA